jgi:hypothetical protein
MDPTAMLIAALVSVPGIGLILWANFVMTEVDDRISSSDELVDMPFESQVTPEHHQHGPR